MGGDTPRRLTSEQYLVNSLQLPRLDFMAAVPWYSDFRRSNAMCNKSIPKSGYPKVLPDMS